MSDTVVVIRTLKELICMGFNFSYDFLSVYDGPTTMDLLISDLTGSYVGGDLRDLTTTSTNSSMLLNFQSDSADTGGGFVLRVNAGKSIIT